MNHIKGVDDKVRSRLINLAESITDKQERSWGEKQREFIKSELENLENAILNNNFPITGDPEEKTITDGISVQQRGTELTDLMTLNVAEDARSFKVVLSPNENEKEGQEREVIVKVESGKPDIEYVIPSIEGTVLLCNLADNTQSFYDPETGQELQEPELRKRNPHFYS